MGLREGKHGREHSRRVKQLFKYCDLGEEHVYLINILANENNCMSFKELCDMSFCDLEKYNIMLDIMSRGKLASTLDNMPKQ